MDKKIEIYEFFIGGLSDTNEELIKIIYELISWYKNQTYNMDLWYRIISTSNINLDNFEFEYKKIKLDENLLTKPFNYPTFCDTYKNIPSQLPIRKKLFVFDNKKSIDTKPYNELIFTQITQHELDLKIKTDILERFEHFTSDSFYQVFQIIKHIHIKPTDIINKITLSSANLNNYTLLIKIFIYSLNNCLKKIYDKLDEYSNKYLNFIPGQKYNHLIHEIIKNYIQTNYDSIFPEIEVNYVKKICPLSNKFNIDTKIALLSILFKNKIKPYYKNYHFSFDKTRIQCYKTYSELFDILKNYYLELDEHIESLDSKPEPKSKPKSNQKNTIIEIVKQYENKSKESNIKKTVRFQTPPKNINKTPNKLTNKIKQFENIIEKNKSNYFTFIRKNGNINNSYKPNQ